MSRKLVIFGAGKTAELAHHYFSTQGDHEVVALVVDAGREPSPAGRQAGRQAGRLTVWPDLAICQSLR